MQILVIGTNPLGINGNPERGTGGMALKCLTEGLIEQGEVLNNCISKSGKVYGLVTVKYPGGKRTVSKKEMEANIDKLYEYCFDHPEDTFEICYSGSGRNLNGYSSKEMAKFFYRDEIPTNVIFESEFKKLIYENSNTWW